MTAGVFVSRGVVRLTALSVGLAIAVPVLAAAPTASASVSSLERPAAVRVAQSGFALLPDEPYRQVAVGYLDSFGLRLDGTVASVTAADGTGGLAPAGLDDVVQIEAGYRHALALDADGNVTVWGQYGDSAPTPTFVPQEVQDADVVQIAAGGNHDLALTADGKVLGWGTDDGDPGVVPAALADETVTAIETGFYGSAAILADGSVVSWGRLPETPAALDGVTVTQLEVGNSGAFAVTAAGELVTWSNYFYDPASAVPAVVQEGRVVAIASAETSAVAVLSDGTVHAWTYETGTEVVPLPPPTSQHPVGVEMDRFGAAVEYATLAVLTPSTITGTPRAGQRLTVRPGTWSDPVDSTTYAWFADGAPIAGATQASYRLKAGDAGRTVTARVTPVRAGYSAEGTTVSAGRIAPGPTTLTVKAPTEVTKGKRFVLTIRGLAYGERFTAVLDGKALASARVSRDGVFSKHVAVPAKARTGRRVIKVVGSYADRTGKRVVTVKRATR